MPLFLPCRTFPVACCRHAVLPRSRVSLTSLAAAVRWHDAGHGLAAERPGPEPGRVYDGGVGAGCRIRLLDVSAGVARADHAGGPGERAAPGAAGHRSSGRRVHVLRTGHPKVVKNGKCESALNVPVRR